MGLLDNVLGGDRSQSGGGPSGMTLALMALLAYRTYQGKGRLADMMGRTPPAEPLPGGGQPGSLQPGPAQPAGGGLGGLLGGLLGGSSGASAGSGGLGDILRGGLGGILGGAAGSGAAGGFLGTGLNELINKMQQGGQGEAANSWIGTGDNHPIPPDQLERSLGRDTLETLSSETGKPYNEVLSELSRSLPQTVDKLTPHGRLPTDDEHKSWI